MIVIGEKINGAIPSTAEAIAKRDEAYILKLVKMQEEAGADYLDVCAGTSPEEEKEALLWLIDVVQRQAVKPVCIDSPDPYMLLEVFPKLEKSGLINSVSLEGEKCEVLFPLLRDNPEWGVIALCCDNSGVAESADAKVKNAVLLIEKAAGYGITPDRIHIDPLVLALSAVNDSAIQFTDAVRRIREAYPTVHVTAALSNISYGLPVRRVMNSHFLTLCMQAGLDSVIADPVSRDVYTTLAATEALLNRDRHCRKYTTAYRKGKIGPVK